MAPSSASAQDDSATLEPAAETEEAIVQPNREEHVKADQAIELRAEGSGEGEAGEGSGQAVQQRQRRREHLAKRDREIDRK